MTDQQSVRARQPSGSSQPPLCRVCGAAELVPLDYSPGDPPLARLSCQRCGAHCVLRIPLTT